MSNYIVLDLEWNQGSPSTENPKIPFEILEIGAVKLDDKNRIVDRFDRYVRPQVYKKMHFMTQKIIHLKIKDLKDADPFVVVMKDFLDWCEDDYIFCTWGSLDLTELQYNMQFYNMNPLSEEPFTYLDVQKLFSLNYEDGKSRRSLEYAVDFLHLDKSEAFHRAENDAYYTALILKAMFGSPVMKRYSFDVFHTPSDILHEVHVTFDTYSKYISREFKKKQYALSDKEVSSMRCFKCGNPAKIKIHWFTLNSKHYLCLAKCKEHGFLKGKIRIKKAENGNIYVVKTIKKIKKDDAALLYDQEKKSKTKQGKIKSSPD
ncbi:MAG: exonuclease domain-containing protein [Lachnospiraceae bacterium]|nr:exonuclease domain-containing protein [Lachnospiraceae bacterium]